MIFIAGGNVQYAVFKKQDAKLCTHALNIIKIMCR